MKGRKIIINILDSSITDKDVFEHLSAVIEQGKISKTHVDNDTYCFLTTFKTSDRKVAAELTRVTKSNKFIVW